MSLGYRTMREHDSEVRTKRYGLDEKSRKVSDLEKIIREFEMMATDLDRQIMAEEDRTGVRDNSHFAYSTFAKSAGQRRDNLRASIQGLRSQLEAALREREDAIEQLARANAMNEVREEVRPVRRRHERMSGAALR